MASEQKYKENDDLMISFESSNRRELLVFTDRQQVYKARVADFADTKASVLGVFLPTALEMDEGENVLTMLDPGDYKSELLLVFQNGKVARIPMAAYETKTNRRRLTGAYSDKSPLVAVLPLTPKTEYVLRTTEGRALIFKSDALAPKTSRTTQGVAVMTPKKKHVIDFAAPVSETPIQNLSRYRTRTIPAAGALLKEEDRGEEQMSLI